MMKDLAGALLLLLVAAGYYGLAGDINPSALDDAVGAAGIPRIYAVLGAATGLAMAVKSAAAWSLGRAAPRLADLEGRRLLKAVAMLGIGAAYLAAVTVLGDPLALAGGMAAAELGHRPDVDVGIALVLLQLARLPHVDVLHTHRRCALLVRVAIVAFPAVPPRPR